MKRASTFRLWAPAVLLAVSAISPVVCLSAAGQTPQSNVRPLLEKAHDLEVRGRLDLAAQTWQQVLLSDPNNTEALGGLARAAKYSGDLALSNTYISRLRAINPNDPGIARAEAMTTQVENNQQLRQAGRLAEQGQYGQAMTTYRQLYGDTPPPGDTALAYYETEAATEEGRPHAVAGLRALAQRFPTDARYQIALGRILTYNPRTRPEGRHLLERYPNDPEATEALRQSLLWDSQNPATAAQIRAYLLRHPDQTLETALREERSRRRPMTEAERAEAAVNATRTAEDRLAYRELNARRLEQAESRFKEILAKHPDDPNALAGMGYIRMQQANFGGAISFLVQARQDGSKDPALEGALATSRFWYTMGEGAIALNEDNLPAAERQYRAALQMRPASSEALEGLGGALLKAEQPEAAVPVFNAYVKLKPSAAHAWRGLFLAQYGSGNARLALDTERQAPAAVRAELSKDPLYLVSLASALTDVGRDADAQRVLRSALDLPFSVDDRKVESDTRLQYAALLQRANHLDQAAGLYRQVLAKEPNNVAAYQGLVRVQHAQGRDDLALQTIEAMPQAVYGKAMHDSGFDLTVASIYQADKRLDVAQDILEKTMQVQAAQGEKPAVNVQIELAGIYLQREDTQRAFALYQQILAQHPDNLNAWKGLLDTLHTTGRDQEALAQVQVITPAVRQKLEGDVNYLQTVAAVYNGLGQPREAEVFLRRVQEHYAAEHTAPPADVDIQNAWLLYNGMNDAGLYRQLMYLGARTDLTEAQRRTIQTIWANWAVRRASQAAAAGNTQRALAILNATARAFPGNPAVIKALAGGYTSAGMGKQAVAIWKAMDLKSAPVEDYKGAIGAALAANDEKDAETWLRFALNQYPSNPDILLLGAKFEEQRGDTNRAADYYRASLKRMPADDPGAGLATELSNPAPNADLPGSLRGGQDLPTLLAPGTDRPARTQPELPYLPGGYGAYGPPVPLADPNLYLPSANPAPAQPPYPATQPASRPRLRDYVPQAALELPQQNLPRADAANLPAFVAQVISQEDQPVLSAVSFQHQQIVRLTQQAQRHGVILTQQPSLQIDVQVAGTVQSEPELSQGASFRGASFHASLPQQQTAQSLTQQPSGQAAQDTQNAQPAGQTVNTSTPPANGVVYGPYVPYVPLAKPAPIAPPAQQPSQPQVQQPQTSNPLTAPAAAPQTAQPANGTSANGIVYGPYVPYIPPPPAPKPVQLGATPSANQVKQPEVTDVLPKAKYAHASRARSRAQARAAEAARHREAAAAAAEAATGQSRPPAEDINVAPAEPAYTQTPSLTITPAQYPGAAGSPMVPQPSNSSAAAPQQRGDSYGQQYPQPGSAEAPSNRVVAHRRSRTARPAPEPGSGPAPAQAEQPQPSLSYPGVGSALGYQPYPLIGPAYPLPPAPTDQDLIDRQLPPLRGGYGGVLPPAPLTPRQQAERDLAALEASYSGWLGGTASARYRSGIVGYDRLTDLETSFEASYTAANNVRFTVVPKAVFLNSGQLNVFNFNGLANSPIIGTYNTETASNNPPEQSANGIGGELQVTARNFAVAVGYTPYEFLVQNVTGRALFRPNEHFTLFFNRDAVTETQLSYAGLRDPGSATAVYGGNIWGGVVQTGGGARFDAGNEKAGFYISADGGDLSGYHVLDNTKFEATAGAYFLAHTFPGYGRLNIGGSIFGMHYSHNERPLSYGLGGYFSPDAYVLATVPVTFTGRYGPDFHYTIAGAVGVQTFQEDNQLYFPLDRGLETSFTTSAACTAPSLANHTCGQYPTNSNTGGNYSINTEGAYRISEHWFGGGFLSANNTNNYNTVTGGFFVRYLFRPQVSTEDYPTGLFPVEGFRPLRVP